MIDAMVNTVEAFLDRFSISRITMGDIVSFVNFLELDNTKQKLKKTLNTLKVRFETSGCFHVFTTFIISCMECKDKQKYLQNQIFALGIHK